MNALPPVPKKAILTMIRNAPPEAMIAVAIMLVGSALTMTLGLTIALNGFQQSWSLPGLDAEQRYQVIYNGIGGAVGSIIAFPVVFLFLGMYFIPIWIAIQRDSRFKPAIMVLTIVSIPLDLLVGFGLLIWVGSLVWAISSPTGKALPPLPGNTAAQLSQLAALHQSGHLSDAEFQTQKSRLLS